MVEAVADQGEAFDLDRARAAFPAPAHLPDRIVNRAELAEAMGVSENTISAWLKKGLPVEEKGTNGSAYQFRLVDCFAWRRWHEAAEDRRKAEDREAAAQWSLFFRGEAAEDSQPQKTAKDIKAESEAQLAQMAANQKRGELIRTAAVRGLLEDLLVQFQNALITLPDFAEREFGLTPDQVDKLEIWSKETLTEARETIRAEIIERPGAVVPIAREGVK